jgi:hypothetical protein
MGTIINGDHDYPDKDIAAQPASMFESTLVSHQPNHGSTAQMDSQNFSVRSFIPSFLIPSSSQRNTNITTAIELNKRAKQLLPIPGPRSDIPQLYKTEAQRHLKNAHDKKISSAEMKKELKHFKASLDSFQNGIAEAQATAREAIKAINSITSQLENGEITAQQAAELYNAFSIKHGFKSIKGDNPFYPEVRKALDNFLQQKDRQGNRIVIASD